MNPDSINQNFEQLHQALARLLQADFAPLQSDIQSLQEQLQQLEVMSSQMSGDQGTLHTALRELVEITDKIDRRILRIQTDLTDQKKVAERLKPVLGPVFRENVQQAPDLYTEAIAPVITPAIREQIRNNRMEMIAALYPIIGQTIGKAIFEAFQDLRRSIDTRLKQNLDLRQRFFHLVARVRGVSGSDLLLRESLPYSIKHVFLIHRQTGLLLKQVSPEQEKQDMDLISAMLTAIRDFARDTFGAGESELEEIQYGDSRILLKTGQFAYLAVVVRGFEPPGYANLLQRVTHDLNIDYEHSLRDFTGEMDTLPDIGPALFPLLNPTRQEWETDQSEGELSRGQKIALGGGAGGIVVLLVLGIFACVFSIRLWPVAFPAPTATPTRTAMPTFTSTMTPSPTMTFTPTITATATVTFTPSPLPTATPTPLRAVMTGSAWVRLLPDANAEHYPIIVMRGTLVDVLAVYGTWAKISWTNPLGYNEGWVPMQWVGITTTILPPELVTPIK